MRIVIGRGGTVLDGRIDIGLDRRWRALSKRRPDSSVIIFQITGRLGLAWRGGVSSPRGTKARNRRLLVFVRDPSRSGCCGARSQLSDAHNILFELVRSAEIWVWDVSGGWIRFTPLKRISDGSFHSFERFGPLTLPGALFFSLLRSERRQFFSLSVEHARIPSLWCAKIAICAEASRKCGNKGKRDLFA